MHRIQPGRFCFYSTMGCFNGRRWFSFANPCIETWRENANKQKHIKVYLSVYLIYLPACLPIYLPTYLLSLPRWAMQLPLLGKHDPLT